MDVLQVIKLVSIPRWVKFCALLIIVGFISLALYSVFGGKRLGEGSLVQAGSSLLGVLVPLAIVVILLSFYESGIKPLRKSTETLLTGLVPEILREAGLSASSTVQAQVDVQKIRANSYLYQLRTNNSELKLELQINVKKVTLVIYLKQQPGLSQDPEQLRTLFAHTFNGAESEGYKINKEFACCTLADSPYRKIVMYKQLPNDFLWNSAEKLYFTQDLLVCIESFLDEGKALFSGGQTHHV